MINNYTIIPLLSQPAIQRDGTAYSVNTCTDGRWVRFVNGFPKKIGGCDYSLQATQNFIRTMFLVSQNNELNLYIGHGTQETSTAVGYYLLESGNINQTFHDRTPAYTFPEQTNMEWYFYRGTFLKEEGEQATAQDLLFTLPVGCELQDQTELPLFGKETNSTQRFQEIVYNNSTSLTPVTASGGAIVCGPVMVVFGNGGRIRWSNINNYLSISPIDNNWPLENSLTIASSKLVAAWNVIGSQVPTALVWSLNSLHRITLTQIDEKVTFVSTMIEDSISIISRKSLVKMDQMIFWIGVDQFYYFNGVVQTLVNVNNRDWFFNHLNKEYAWKIWGIPVSINREVWWFYPRGKSTECNAVVIFNLETKTYSDSFLKEGEVSLYAPFLRSAGLPATSIYPYPLMASSTLIPTPHNSRINTYPIWSHEKGFDCKVVQNLYAIESSFTTRQFDLWSNDPSAANLTRNLRIALDFKLEGSMQVECLTKDYPQQSFRVSTPQIFNQDTPFKDFSIQGGITAFRFTSNTVGSSFFGGKNLYFLQAGDALK